MIGILNYGMGNLLSVKNALDYLGESSEICDNYKKLDKYSKIIIPGVGSFPDCIKNIKKMNFMDTLNTKALDEKIPILGICLGMQIMASVGYEMGVTPGLNWFDAKVDKIKVNDKSIKIPNIGWEAVHYNQKSTLFNNLPNNPDFYFVHSYFMKCDNENEVSSWYNLGETKITASIQKNNIFGTQFHPEKSSDLGRELLINFLDY